VSGRDRRLCLVDRGVSPLHGEPEHDGYAMRQSTTGAIAWLPCCAARGLLLPVGCKRAGWLRYRPSDIHERGAWRLGENCGEQQVME
jgi:hypothetical protein